MQLEVKYGQSIFDVALICYQDASRAYDLISDNPQIDNINSDLTGMILSYTPATVTQKEALKTITVTQNNVTIGFMQSLFDVALQYYGSADRVYDVIIENGLENLASDPTGINLKYTTNNTFAPLYYRTNNITVATKPIKPTGNEIESFILRTDYGYLLRTDYGKFPR